MPSSHNSIIKNVFKHHHSVLNCFLIFYVLFLWNLQSGSLFTSKAEDHFPFHCAFFALVWISLSFLPRFFLLLPRICFSSAKAERWSVLIQSSSICLSYDLISSNMANWFINVLCFGWDSSSEKNHCFCFWTSIFQWYF